MRIERLELARFGRFTDRTIDFGDGKGTDLHIVYGPNEAGKSTMLDALGDLLFGMPSQSRHAHLHDYKSLELRARIRQHDQSLDICRYKNTLTDGAGERIEQSVLDLHGLTREAFQARFSFDRARLEAGSEAMLENKGDLGEALFSASSGLPDINSILDAAMQTSDAFYEPRKTKDKVLPALLDELKLIDEELKLLDLQSPEWKRRKEAAAMLETALREAVEALAALRSRRASLERQRAASTWARGLTRARSGLAALGELPDVPLHWHSHCARLVPLDAALASRIGAALGRVSDLEKKIAELVPDEVLLSFSPRVHAAVQSLEVARADAVTRAELAARIDADDDRLGLLRRSLGVADDVSGTAVVPGVEQLERIGKLIRERDTLDTALSLAREEWRTLSAQGEALCVSSDTTVDAMGANPSIEAAKDDADSIVPNLPTVDPTPLASLVAHVRQTANTPALDLLARRELEEHSALEAALTSLAPWSGDAASLSALRVPTIGERSMANDALSNAFETLRQVEADQARLEAERKSLEIQRRERPEDDAIDDAHAAASRAHRDRAWQAHLGAIDAQNTDRQSLQSTAREFALALQADDVLGAERLRHGDRIATLRRLDSELADLASRSGELELEHSRAIDDVTTARAEVTRLAGTLKLEPGASMADIDAWLVRRDTALERAARLHATTTELAEANARQGALSARLSDALASVRRAPEPEPHAGARLEELLVFADKRVRTLEEAAERARHRQAERERLTRELRQRRRGLADQEASLTDWRKRWDSAVKGLWFAERDVDTVDGLFETLRIFSETLSKRDEKVLARDRLDATRAARRDVLLELLAAATEVADAADLHDEALYMRIAELASRDESATRMLEERDRLAVRATHEKAELEALEHERDPILRELDEMRVQLGVDDHSELSARLSVLRERDGQRATAATAEAGLIEALGDDSVDPELERLALLDREALTTDIDLLDAEHARLEADVGDRRLAAREAQQALDSVTGDAAVAALAERRANLLLEIRERAEDTLRMRLGREAVLEGVRRYRDRHRGGLLLRAKDAFTMLTCGAYENLRTRPDGRGNDRLEAVTADGRALGTEALSDGTRFQLYLALRIAAYHEYATHRPALPFVVDDVMETFDDERTAAAVGELAKMAALGQVIYLTHQRSVVEIARRELGAGVRVCELQVTASTGPTISG